MSDSNSCDPFSINSKERFYTALNEVIAEAQIADPSIHDIPARVRGESFNQPHLVTYGYSEHEFGVSLLACHKDRAIVVQAGIAFDADSHAEFPRLSKAKIKTATEFLLGFRKEFLGIKATMLRLLKRDPLAIRMEGPFIPADPGLACMMLIVRISRDAHFDRTYDRARRFLELHPANDDRQRFLADWKPAPEPQRPPPYPWTAEELAVVEKMARLEPCEIDDDPWDLLRREYNEFVFGQVNRDAANAATDILRKIFVRECE